MSDKFANVPEDSGTTTLFRSPMKLGELDILYEKWRWGGIDAESIIFANEDVEALSDEDLEALVRQSPIVEKDSKVTISRLAEYSFVNFNFKVEE